MLKNTQFKKVEIGGILITGVPAKDKQGIPVMTKGVSIKIGELVLKAKEKRIKEIPFSYKL